MIIENKWLDETRFIPIINDLRRQTQPIIRYRLDDVLQTNPTSSTAITKLLSIEGREGDVFYFEEKSQEQLIKLLFYDLIRQHLIQCPLRINDYQLCQTALNTFEIKISPMPTDKKRTFLSQI